MLERLEQQDCWSLLEKEESCAHGMLILARALAEEHWDLVQPTVETLGANLMSVYDSHRITVVAFYSEVHKSSSYQVCTNIVLLVLLGTCCALHTLCAHVYMYMYSRKYLWDKTFTNPSSPCIAKHLLE